MACQILLKALFDQPGAEALWSESVVTEDIGLIPMDSPC